MFCEKCGSKIDDDGYFCPVCGTPASKDESITTGQQKMEQRQNVVEQHQQSPYQPQPLYYQPGTHPYNKLGGFLMVITVANFIFAGLIFFYLMFFIIARIFEFDQIFDRVGYRDFNRFIEDLLNLPKKLDGNYKRSYFPDFFVETVAGSAFLYIVNIILTIMHGVCRIRYPKKILTRDSKALRYIQKRCLWLMILSGLFCIGASVWGHYALSSLYDSRPLIMFNVCFIFGCLFELVISSIYFSTSVRVRTYMRNDLYLRHSVFNKFSQPPAPADTYFEQSFTKTGR